MSKQISLTKAQRVQIEAAAEVLRPWGLSWELKWNGPHAQLRIIGPRGVSDRVTLASTPRDIDAAACYARTNARKALNRINQRLGL